MLRVFSCSFFGAYASWDALEAAGLQHLFCGKAPLGLLQLGLLLLQGRPRRLRLRLDGGRRLAAHLAATGRDWRLSMGHATDRTLYALRGLARFARGREHVCQECSDAHPCVICARQAQQSTCIIPAQDGKQNRTRQSAAASAASVARRCSSASRAPRSARAAFSSAASSASAAARASCAHPVDEFI